MDTVSLHHPADLASLRAFIDAMSHMTGASSQSMPTPVNLPREGHPPFPKQTVERPSGVIGHPKQEAAPPKLSDQLKREIRWCCEWWPPD